MGFLYCALAVAITYEWLVQVVKDRRSLRRKRQSDRTS
jgi:hypothetical protein